MWKSVLAGTTALAIAGTTLAYAQRPDDGGRHMHRWRANAADITAFADARIAALHAGLQLNAEQEKNWPAMESAMRDLAKQRSDRFTARHRANEARGPIERLASRAQKLEARAAALKKLADAAGPLYDSLNADQKHRFMILARLGMRQVGAMRAHHKWRHGWHHRWGGPAHGLMGPGGPQPL